MCLIVALPQPLSSTAGGGTRVCNIAQNHKIYLFPPHLNLVSLSQLMKMKSNSIRKIKEETGVKKKKIK